MRPTKTLKSWDLIIRGLFLSVVVIGGIVGHLQQTEAAPETAVREPAVEAGMGLGFGLSAANQCEPTDSGSGATSATSGARPASSRQVLSGSVRSSAGCAPIGGAKIEFWPAGRSASAGAKPDISFAGVDGQYRLQCDVPETEDNRAGYIYLRVSADGYHTLTTQYTPQPSRPDDQFDIVLEPGE